MLIIYILAVTTKKLKQNYVPDFIQHSLQFSSSRFRKTPPFFSLNTIFWCLSQSCAEEDRSAEAAPPHGEVQRLCAYSAHPERSASGAQRRCGVHIRGIVLYYLSTLWIHAVAPQLNVGQGYPGNAMCIERHLFLFFFVK